MDPAYMKRRRHVRHRIDAPVFLWSAASGVRAGLRGHCLNLSEAGAGVVVAGPWQPGQVLQLELALPGIDPLIVGGRLVHRNRLYCGVEFLGVTETARATLSQVLEQAARGSDPGRASDCERFLSP